MVVVGFGGGGGRGHWWMLFLILSGDGGPGPGEYWICSSPVVKKLQEHGQRWFEKVEEVEE